MPTRWVSAQIAGLLLVAAPLAAQSLPPITIGGGLRTSFIHTSPDEADDTDAFVLDSARLYVNGPVTDTIKFMFNTEYDGSSNKIGVLDAVARLEMAPKFNIWMGRFLPPSDRANLYGPYYSHHWGVYTDGLQNGHPFVFQGRDNGVAYWGDFSKLKVSFGVFDGATATGTSEVITAGRVQFDFWDKESGYYLNGTYYGGKNLLGLGAAVQVQDGDTATTVDFLLEKKLGDEGGVITIESEYANYDGLGGYDSAYASSEGAYVLGAYLFPKTVGVGKFEVLGKYAHAAFSKGSAADYDQDTTEFNFNYVIKEFNARVMFFIRNTSFSEVKTDSLAAGVGLQIQL